MRTRPEAPLLGDEVDVLYHDCCRLEDPGDGARLSDSAQGLAGEHDHGDAVEAAEQVPHGLRLARPRRTVKQDSPLEVLSRCLERRPVAGDTEHLALDQLEDSLRQHNLAFGEVGAAQESKARLVVEHLGAEADIASPGCPNAFPPDPKLFTDSAFVEGRHQQLLTAPAEPTIKMLAPGQGCSALIDRGWRGRCARFSGAAGAGIWILERRDSGRKKRVLLYTHRGGSTWDLVLRASDETGLEFEPRVETVDLAGDGDQRVLVLLREVDADATDGVPPPLVVDAVEPDGKIAVHLFTSAGRTGPAEARATRGRGLEVWNCPYDCGPTNPTFRYRRIAYSNGKWQVVEEGTGRPTN